MQLIRTFRHQHLSISWCDVIAVRKLSDVISQAEHARSAVDVEASAGVVLRAESGPLQLRLSPLNFRVR